MIEEVYGGILVILCGIEYSDAFLSICPSLFHSITPLSFPFCFSCILVCIYPILMKPLLFVPIIRGAN